MKHLSMGLTALLLGALPLAAAAFDYGPNQAMLAANQALAAADSDLPPLPGAQPNAAARQETSGATSDEAANGAPSTPGADRNATATPTPRRGASASNTPAHHAAPPSSAPLTVPLQPSWQSLLPGSIQ